MILHILDVLPDCTLPKEAIYDLCFAFDPFHVLNTCLILNIFIAHCWGSDEGVKDLIAAFNSMKREGHWKTICEPFFRSLILQKNLFSIGTIVTFINSFIEADTDDDVKNHCKE